MEYILRPDFCGLWRCRDGRMLYVEPGPSDGFLVTITPGLYHLPYPAFEATHAPTRETRRLPAQWMESHRLPFLMIETGRPGVGRTYDLHFAVRSAGPDDGGRYEWRPPRPDDPVEVVRGLPEVGGGFVDSVVLHHTAEDYRFIKWAEPFLRYRKATAATEERFVSIQDLAADTPQD